MSETVWKARVAYGRFEIEEVAVLKRTPKQVRLAKRVSAFGYREVVAPEDVFATRVEALREALELARDAKQRADSEAQTAAECLAAVKAALSKAEGRE